MRPRTFDALALGTALSISSELEFSGKSETAAAGIIHFKPAAIFALEHHRDSLLAIPC